MANEAEENQEFAKLLSRLVNSPLDKEETEALEELLLDRPERQRIYLEYVWLDSYLLDFGQQVSRGSLDRPVPANSLRRGMFAWGGYLVAGLLFVGGFIAYQYLGEPKMPSDVPLTASASNPPPTQTPVASRENAESFSSAKFDSDYRAVFRQAPSSTTRGGRLVFQKDYVLQAGMTKIEFESGAEVVLSSPAVFHVEGNNKLSISLGSCSVFAPEGAQGFQVVTPTGNILDLGTKFSVAVEENGAASVAVVSGEAEVSIPNRQAKKILQEGEFARLDTSLQISDEVDESQRRDNYDLTIPDHIVSYKSVLDETGRSAELAALTVQRDGVHRTYQAEDLILPAVTHYLSPIINNSIVPASAGPEEYVRLGPMDLSFTRGFINPGGSESLHQGAFEFGPDGTPGMNIVFSQPVVNSPGPDIILFDVQLITHSLLGDIFRLYPISDSDEAIPVIIKEYDIDGQSNAAQTISTSRLVPLSSERFEDGTPMPMSEHSQIEFTIPCRIFTVGIDLDDMGIPPGGTIKGFFLQDVLDDENFIDPVVIVGLPPC